MNDEQSPSARARGADTREFERAVGCASRKIRTTVYVARPGAIETRLDGVAAAVWEGLDIPASVSSLSDRIHGFYGGAPSEAAQLIGDAVQMLLNAGVVVVRADK